MACNKETWVQIINLYLIMLLAIQSLGHIPHSLPSPVLLLKNETGWCLEASHTQTPSGLAVRTFPLGTDRWGFQSSPKKQRDLNPNLHILDRYSNHLPICKEMQHHILFLPKKCARLGLSMFPASQNRSIPCTIVHY